MPAEQPPKTICEICGGAHSTSAHVPIVENVQEEESTQEKEPNREAMKKVVDIFATEDLKYRNDPIVPTLETGVPTPSTSFLYEPFGRLNEETRRKMLETRQLIKQERETGEGAGGVMKRFREMANVFYPEGMIKALRDRVQGTKTVETWYKNIPIETSENLGDFGLLSRLTPSIAEAFQQLNHDEQRQIAQSSGCSLESIRAALFKNRIFYRQINIDEPKNDDARELKRVLEALFSNEESWELLRKSWLKIFFQEANDTDERRGSLIDKNYNLLSGVVLSPETKTAVSPHGDYPTQATILSPRVKPKDIIGIFVNSDSPTQVGYLADNEAIFHNPPYSESFKKTQTPLRQLETSFFRMPKHPLEYVLGQYARAFMLSLEKKGIDTNDLRVHFSEYPKHSFSPERKQKAKEICDQLRTALGDKEYNELEVLAKKFIDEQSPVKEGETLWTGLVRLSEQHQLPIYNLRGELLWPKHMTHEQVAEFVAEKPAEKK